MSERPSKIISVDEPQHWMPDVSRTFHGRDIMAPVAARLSLGLAPEELGRPLSSSWWNFLGRRSSKCQIALKAK